MGNKSNESLKPCKDNICKDTYYTGSYDDFTVLIKESDIAFIPQNGSLRAQMDTIAEEAI